MDVWYFSSVLVFGLMMSPWLTSGNGESVVYEIYAKKPNTNRSVACGVCEARNGRLARRPELDDWEITFGNWSHLQSMDFWVDLTKTTAGQWLWGDGLELNMNLVTSLPMQSSYNVTYAASNCVLWNMAEPFYMPSRCSEAANILCEIPDPSAQECKMTELFGMNFNSSAGLISYSASTWDECKAACPLTSECWAASWDEDAGKCQLLRSTSATTRPAVPELISDSCCNIVGRTCEHFREMPPEHSEFVCNCGAIDIPETEEEKQKFVEEYKEEVQKELIVPTETLSATVRKKESAPDERKSSTSMGYLGITMLVVVFGGLVLLDLTSLIAHIKNATDNLKKAFAEKGDEGSNEA